jgi:hypothetical protein
MSSNNTARPGSGPEAVRQASAGATAWRAAARAQRTEKPDHSEFYELAAELVDTLRAIHSLVVLLAGQVDRYPDQLEGVAVYDDSRVVDPSDRLATAALHARYVAQALAQAEVDAQAFWSAISHIGLVQRGGQDGPSAGVSTPPAGALPTTPDHSDDPSRVEDGGPVEGAS